MEAFKISVDISEERTLTLALPQNIPLGKAEMMVIVQPLADEQNDDPGREREKGADVQYTVVEFNHELFLSPRLSVTACRQSPWQRNTDRPVGPGNPLRH